METLNGPNHRARVLVFHTHTRRIPHRQCITLFLRFLGKAQDRAGFQGLITRHPLQSSSRLAAATSTATSWLTGSSSLLAVLAAAVL